MSRRAVKLDEPSELTEILSEISLIIHTAASVSLDPEEEGKETKQMLRHWYTRDTQYEKTAVFYLTTVICAVNFLIPRLRPRQICMALKTPNELRSY